MQEGTHAAIATPHYNDEFPRRSATEIQGRVYDAQQELDKTDIPLRLFPGHEVLIQPGMIEDIRAGRIAILNGSRYLLLELWNNTWLPETERVIFELRAYGIIPVLAHVERYRAIQQNHSRLKALLQQGVLAQLTASSLVGMQGRTAKHCAESLLKEGLIQCIATDAHGLQKRRPALASGLQAAVRLLGYEQVYQMIEGCPKAILCNKALCL